MSYHYRRWTYSFRAFIDAQGFNQDREHKKFCQFDPCCPHLKLWDWNLRGSSKNLLRVVRGNRQRGNRHLHVLVGPRLRSLVRWG